jgi:hypothetical protein
LERFNITKKNLCLMSTTINNSGIEVETADIRAFMIYFKAELVLGNTDHESGQQLSSLANRCQNVVLTGQPERLQYNRTFALHMRIIGMREEL